MATGTTPIRTGSPAPADALKRLLELFRGSQGTSQPTQVQGAPQIVSELVYRLAQATTLTRNPQELQSGVVALIDAVTTIADALGAPKAQT